MPSSCCLRCDLVTTNEPVSDEGKGWQLLRPVPSHGMQRSVVTVVASHCCLCPLQIGKCSKKTQHNGKEAGLLSTRRDVCVCHLSVTRYVPRPS